jgi:predicted DNA-binding transcriptional regulator AlpA
MSDLMQLVFCHLEPALKDARSLPADRLPRLLGDLEEVRTTALARLSTPAAPVQASDELLNVAQAAAKLGCSRDFLYKNEFPFVRRLGRKRLYSRNGIEEYLRKQK